MLPPTVVCPLRHEGEGLPLPSRDVTRDGRCPIPEKKKNSHDCDGHDGADPGMGG